MKVISSVALLFAVVILSGCGLLTSESDKKLDSSSALLESDKQVQNSLLAPVKRLPDAIEIVWLVPAGPVERYHVRWGSSPENLDQSRTLSTADLKKIDHPVFGPIYSYTISPISPNQSVYVTLQAENHWGLSPMSQPLTVAPFIDHAPEAK